MSGTAPLVFCARGPEECDGIAEPEEDGEVRYYKCTKPGCGFEFGYQVTGREPDACQLGIPEGIRLAHLAADPEFQRRLREAPVPDSLFSGPPETGVFSGVFLGPTIKRRAE